MRQVCILVTCLGCGCATAAARPEVVVAPAWTLAPPPPAATTRLERSRSLWLRFRSRELEQLLRGAEHSLEYASADARLAQQEASARSARAALYPTFSLDASLSAQSANSRSLGSVSGGFFDAGVQADFEIDPWGKLRQRAAAAERARDGSRYARDEAALNTAAAVTRAYFEVLSLRERIARGRVNLELTERVLKVVEARERAGAALAREVAQQRALLATEQVRVEQLALEETQARVELALVSGKEPSAVEVHATGFEAVEEPVIDATDLQVPERLLTRRPDVASKEAALAATHADVMAARRALLPQLRLVGQAAFQYAFLTRYTELFTKDAYSADGSQLVYSGALVLSQPLFDGGALLAERDAATARRAQAEVAYRRAVLEAVAEVERALRAASSLRVQYEHQHSVVTEARRAFELLETEYRAGAQDIVPVLDAQRTLFRAEDELSQLWMAKLRASVALIKALGAGWADGHPAS